MKVLRVAVVGAGTAGPAAALFIARQGHRVTLFERVPEPTAIGAGIVIQPTGIAVLRELGLAERVLARGAPIRRLLCQTAEGKPVVDLRYETFMLGLCGYGLHRGVLFETLFQALRSEPNVTVRLGVDVAGLEHRPECVDLYDSKESFLGSFDLLVICDGARSKLRQQSGLRHSVKQYPWGALWFVAEDRAQVFRDVLFQVVNGSRRLYGLLPTGVGPEGSTTHRVSLFWSIRADLVDEWRAGGLGPWKQEVLAYAPSAQFALDQIQSPDQLLFSGYHDVVMERWHDRRVVCLGDAAHAMSPQLGQGCNLALMDAHALATCLGRATTVDAALELYTESRREHLSWYQFSTRWLTPFFQSDHDALGVLRDWLMPPACKIPWVGRQMVESMCGVSMGPFERPLPLPSHVVKVI